MELELETSLKFFLIYKLIEEELRVLKEFIKKLIKGIYLTIIIINRISSTIYNNNNSLLNVRFRSLLGLCRLLLIYMWGENSI